MGREFYKIISNFTIQIEIHLTENNRGRNGQ